jgi:hypothetical protein
MSNNDSNKPNHSFFIDVAKIVTAGVILLFCTTLYNLFLAHIWPVSIHFGEYSLNNFIFIFVAVLSSFILAIIILALEIFYVLHTLASGLIYLTTPKDKRVPRKGLWFAPILNVFLLAAMLSFAPFAWLSEHRLRKETSQQTQNAPNTSKASSIPNTPTSTDSQKEPEP